MDKLKRQLNTASNTVESTGVRTRAMERHLRDLEKLPQEAASEKLGLLNNNSDLEDVDTDFFFELVAPSEE